jgi:amino acid transporter
MFSNISQKLLILGELPANNVLIFVFLLVGIFAAIFAVRYILRLNRYLLFFAVAITLAGFLGSWTYNRNEPAFLTPVVDFIAPILPNKADATLNY